MPVLWKNVVSSGDSPVGVGEVVAGMTIPGQAPSAPYGSPSVYRCSPSGATAPAYSRLAAATCAGVRQSDVFVVPVAHVIAA
jgi:hypothetical protein